MKKIISLDAEFIDTPAVSELISIGLVSADGRQVYFEFPYTESALTPWLRQNVVPLLGAEKVTFGHAAQVIRDFIGGSKFDPPEFWAYYGAYDWYWLSRLMGGMMLMPEHWPHLHHDFAFLQHGVPSVAGPEHHALNDALSLMHAMKKRGLVS